jgi:mannose-6-phosphate isomerase-like protein (cupin superfamily)
MVRGARPSPFHFGTDRLRDGEERARLARLGWACRFTNNFRTNPAKGELSSSVIEVYAADPEPVSHPGEEFIFILSGRIRLDISGEVVVLNEGDSLAFDSGRPHSYAPEQGTTIPAKALVVVKQGSYGRRSRRAVTDPNLNP